MVVIRKSLDRGIAEHGWLHSRHTFSFADYYDAKHMGFGVLRVINEDKIDGGAGFGTHGHRDMEIISYVVEGALEHQDSIGNKTTIKPGEVQRMSAGTGIQHSEYNHLKDRQTHFLQVWILPDRNGITPSYEQRSFESDFQKGELTLVVSRDGRDGSISIHQDINLYVLKSQRSGSYSLKNLQNRRGWVQVMKGNLNLANHTLEAGDGAAVTDESMIHLSWDADSEFMVFDLP